MKSVHQYLKKEGSSATERSVFQLLDAIRLSDKELLNYCKATSKTHSTMGEKFFIPLCAEHIHSLIKKKMRLEFVTWIYSHYTFEQSKFTKEFVIKNQISRQNAKTSREKDFYKLTNNSNFGYDCRNNAGNCFFAPVFDKIEEMSYVKRYQNVFDPEMFEFVSIKVLE